MSRPSRKQLLRAITRQRVALRNMNGVLRGYRAEIVRLGGDPGTVRAIRRDQDDFSVDDLEFAEQEREGFHVAQRRSGRLNAKELTHGFDGRGV